MVKDSLRIVFIWLFFLTIFVSFIILHIFCADHWREYDRNWMWYDWHAESKEILKSQNEKINLQNEKINLLESKIYPLENHTHRYYDGQIKGQNVIKHHKIKTRQTF